MWLAQIPLVSGLMVTRASRLPMGRRAVACWKQQSYPNKELVVVSDDDVSELGVPFHLVPKGLRLGDLRNLAVGRARGELVAQWDDDDLYHPDRLKRQVECLSAADKDGCVLERWTLAWPARGLFAISPRRRWEGSLLARRWRLPVYPSLPRGEDTPVVESMNLATLDDPDLYIYNIHGDNTFDSAHFDNIMKSSTMLEGWARENVRRVLEAYSSSPGMFGYPWPP